jgi:hypothetical protein
MRRLLRELDLTSWDNYVPLGFIAAFLGAAFLVGTGVIALPGLVDTDRIQIIFVDIGIGATSGVFAITVSLSLLAIQFASQEYSHRIMSFYIKSVTFWAIITVYLGLIVGTILVEGLALNLAAERAAGVILIGGVLAIALLIPHFVVTAAFLRPEFVIAKLLNRLDAEYLVSIVPELEKGRGRMPSGIDRLLPVVEIVERSIQKGDLSTTRAATERLHTTYLAHAARLNSIYVERYFLDYLMRIGRTAVLATEEQEPAIQVLQLISTVGSQGPAGVIATEDIDDLGFTALKKDAEGVVIQMVDSLRVVFERTALPDAKRAVFVTYRKLVEDLSGTEKRRIMRHFSTCLAETGMEALKKGDLATTDQCLELLESLGHDAGTRRLGDVVLHIVRHMQVLGIAAAPADPDTARRVVRALLRVERGISTSEREVVAATEFAKGKIERVLTRRGGSGASSTRRPASANPQPVTPTAPESAPLQPTPLAPPPHMVPAPVAAAAPAAIAQTPSAPEAATARGVGRPAGNEACQWRAAGRQHSREQAACEPGKPHGNRCVRRGE